MRRDQVLERHDLAAAVHATLVARHRDSPAHDPVAIAALVRAHDPLASATAVDDVVERVLARTVGFGPLDALLDDPTISEVMVNGDGSVWLERSGKLEQSGVAVDAGGVSHLIERIVAPLGLRADRTCPLVDARLPDGSRVNVVVPPLAVDGPCLTIRRFVVRSAAIDDLASPGVAALLEWAVLARLNVLVTGGTGAGKTTLLNALATAIPSSERIVTVEDAAELRLPGHVVRLEARPATADGLGAVTVRELVRNALRMRPDRIVVGEVRGPEALDMLQAMNTGHEGSLSTCHANSPADALRRIETMILMSDVALPLDAVRDQICSSVDFIVHIARQADGSRGVVAVGEVAPDATHARRGAGPPPMRLLADAHGVIDQPTRPARHAAAMPFDPRWATCAR
jgi:pilus assembly protein CpaF